MKNLVKVISLVFLMIVGGCCEVFDECDEPQENSSDNLSGLIDEYETEVILPTGSSLAPDDLKISTLFTQEADVKASKCTIRAFKDSPYELVIATNKDENPIMLSFFDTRVDDKVIVDALSTAKTLVMLSPWVVDLSEEARTNLYFEMEDHPSFSKFLNFVENKVRQGSLEDAGSSELLTEIVEFETSFLQNRTEGFKPLKWNLIGNTVEVENLSAASYQMAISSPDGNGSSSVTIPGSQKFSLSLTDSKNRTVTTKKASKISIPIPSNGKWCFKADNGLSGSGSIEERDALYRNLGDLTLNFFKIFSGDLVADASCLEQTAEYIFSKGTDLTSFINNEEDVLKNTLLFFQNSMADLVLLLGECIGKPENLNGLEKYLPFLRKAMAVINLPDRISQTVNTSILITDWFQYESEYEFCVVKTDDGLENIFDITMRSWSIPYSQFHCDGMDATVPIIFHKNNTVSLEDSFWTKATCKVGAELVGSASNCDIGSNAYSYDGKNLSFTLSQTVYSEINGIPNEVGQVLNYTFTGQLEGRSRFRGQFSSNVKYHEGLANEDCSKQGNGGIN